MTKAIRSYPKEERGAVIKRRLARKTGGIGTAAAMDAEKAIARGSIKKSNESDEPSSEPNQ